MVAIITQESCKYEGEFRNVTPLGIGIFTNQKINVGTDISILFTDGHKSINLEGEVRWIAGDENGELIQSKFEGFEYLSDGTIKNGPNTKIIQKKFGYPSLEKCFGQEARGWKYTVGIKIHGATPGNPHELYLYKQAELYALAFTEMNGKQ